MQLSIAERMNLLVLTTVTERRGSLDLLRLLREFSAETGFSEKEIVDAKITQNGDVYEWDESESARVVKDIEIGAALCNGLMKQIEAFGDAGTATDAMLSLHDRLKEDQEPNK